MLVGNYHNNNVPINVGPANISHGSVYIRQCREALILHIILSAMEGKAGRKLDAYNHRARVITA